MRETTKELYHHGILGMKWGIRRYQNKDGSLTPAGKKRAAKMKDDYTKLTGKRLIRKPTKKAEPEKEDIRNKKLKDLTDAELNERINRLQKEKQLVGLETDLSGKGSKFVRSVGKDVVAPAAINAGKQLLTDLLLKVGKEKLGLNPQTTKDALDDLRKEVDTLELKKRKSVAEDYFNKREEKKKNAESNKQKESKKDEPERVDAEFMGESTTKKSDKSTNREADIISEATIIREETGRSVADEYRYLRLPGPK